MNYNKNKLDNNCEEVLLKDQNNIEKNIKHEAHFIDKETINLLQKKIVKLNQNLLHMQIESKQKLDNFCVRTNKEIHNVLNFCLEKFILDLLPVIDNLERTVVLIKKSDDNQKEIYNELKLLLKSFLDLLCEFGVKVIDQENVLFDPSKHEAMSVNYSSHIEPNNIITILQKGYLLNQRLLRPAMVIVSQRN